MRDSSRHRLQPSSDRFSQRREMDYALRVLRALHQNGQQSAAAIAQREHMPKAITLKLLS